jgi:xanthine dehydrogenase accessory factor
MTATQTILAHYQHLRTDHREAALATVVKVEGSAYRRPGARMLVSGEGTRIGAISGGCLEADVVLRAQQVITTGEAEYVLYDTRHANGDLIVELGCQGAVGILIERTDNPEVQGSLQFLASFTQERGEGAMATVFRIEGTCPVRVGERLQQRGQEAVGGSLATSCLTASLQQACGQVRQSGHAQTRTVRFSSGLAEVLIEPVHSPPALLLCGAGQDAIPLAQMARLLGWQVTVMDHRPSLLTQERFPGAETRLITQPERLPDYCTPDARTAVVLMTHSYVNDRLWLQHLLPLPFGYVGLLGPRKRGAQLLADLRQEGTVFDAAWLGRLHSPVGLDLGSETSEEIALAVLSEIQAVLHDREGGFLRDRKGSIHPTSSSPGAVYPERSFEVASCPLSV